MILGPLFSTSAAPEVFGLLFAACCLSIGLSHRYGLQFAYKCIHHACVHAYFCETDAIPHVAAVAYRSYHLIRKQLATLKPTSNRSSRCAERKARTIALRLITCFGWQHPIGFLIKSLRIVEKQLSTMSGSPLVCNLPQRISTALRKWRRYTLYDMSVGHAHDMTLVLPAFRSEAMMKTRDPAFTSLQDSDEKLCGFLGWLLDATEVHHGKPQQRSIMASSQQLEHAVQALSCVKKCLLNISCFRATFWRCRRCVFLGL